MNKIPFFSPLLTGTPKAVIVHHFFGQAIFLEASKFAAHYVYWTEKVFFKLYRQKPILYYSPSTKKELLAQGFPEKNFHYVPIAVDLSLYRVLPDVPKADVPLCVYLGRIKRYKSVDHLVETMPTILEKIPNARFLIVGDGDDKERLEKMAVELNVSGAVEFLGFVSQEEKVRILNRAWVVVSTSSKEGWGLTMTEANACGTPVVAANSAGLRDAVIHRETGLLYEYGNREQLSASIVEVLQNNEFRNNLAKGGLLNARKFTWDDAANITIDTLNSIIGAAKV